MGNEGEKVHCTFSFVHTIRGGVSRPIHNNIRHRGTRRRRGGRRDIKPGASVSQSVTVYTTQLRRLGREEDAVDDLRRHSHRLVLDDHNVVGLHVQVQQICYLKTADFKKIREKANKGAIVPRRRRRPFAVVCRSKTVCMAEFCGALAIFCSSLLPW